MPGVIDNPALATYVTASIALAVLAAFFRYLWSIDRRVAELRRQLTERLAPPEGDPLRAAASLQPQRRVAQEQEDVNSEKRG